MPLFSFIISVVLCCLFITTVVSDELLLWVNSETGVDSSFCGDNSTFSCKTISHSLARSYEYPNIDTIIVVLETTISNEVVFFNDSRVTQVEFEAEDVPPRGVLQNTTIRIFPAFTISDYDIYNSHFETMYLTLMGSELFNSSLNVITSTDQRSVVSYSNFYNSTATFDYVRIANSNFVSSPLTIRAASITSSVFSYSQQTALTVVTGDISGSTFSFNYAQNGGAIYSKAILMIDTTTFTNNTATENGGAIYSEGIFTFSNSIFTSNNAQSGGAVYVVPNEDANVVNCVNSTFGSNSATSNGGAIYSENVQLEVYKNNWCLLNTNFAGGKGGGLYTTKTDSYGAGVWRVHHNSAQEGGGMYFLDSIISTSANFSNNFATQGSAIYAHKTSLQLFNTNFADKHGNSNSEVGLHGSSSNLALWQNVIFEEGPSALSCDDCEDIVCDSTAGCGECPLGGCITFNETAVCVAFKNNTKFGCEGISSCVTVASNFTTCACPQGYELQDGRNCVSPGNNPPVLPAYAIVLIALGGAALIGVVIFLVVRWRNRRGTYTTL